MALTIILWHYVFANLGIFFIESQRSGALINYVDLTSNTNLQSVSIVCPFYNEMGIIESSIQRMVSNLKKTPYLWELILVNDGSTDNSLAIATQAAESLQEFAIKIVSYPYNQGRGCALKAGINQACGEIIVTTEVDCSWGDDIVTQLVTKLTSDPSNDFITASPHLPGGGLKNVPKNRIFFTKIGNKLIRTFFISQITMNTGMTRAYYRRVIQPLIVHNKGKDFHLEVLLKLLTIGCKVDEIPATITWPERKNKQQKNKTRKSSTNLYKTVISHIKFLAIAQPVKYFGFFSVASFLAGTGFLFASVFNLLTNGPAVYFAIIGLIMFLFSLLFMGFSVIFTELRELMREKWLSYYDSKNGPATKPGELVFNSSVESEMSN